MNGTNKNMQIKFKRNSFAYNQIGKYCWISLLQVSSLRFYIEELKTSFASLKATSSSSSSTLSSKYICLLTSLNC
jgi:hypothetical protein